MASQPGGAKGVRRKEEILRVAARVFAEKGFQRTTTREIGDLAGINSASLYYYFDSKESIIRDLVGQYWEELFNAYTEVFRSSTSPVDRFRALVVASLTVSGNHIEQVTILHQEWPSLRAIDVELEDRMARLQKTWVDVIRDGMDSGVFLADVDPILVYRTIMGAIAWVPRWYRPTGHYRIEEVAASQAEVMLRGIRNDWEPSPVDAGVVDRKSSGATQQVQSAEHKGT